MHQIKLPHSPKLFSSIQHNAIDILLVLLDYDGCIARTICDQKIHNTEILKHIKNKIKEINPLTAIIANGSNRQTSNIDQMNKNRNNNGSCFDNLPKIANHIQKKNSSATIKFLKLTVSDVINRLHTGDVMSEKKAEKFAIDEKKILLLLTQVHYNAQRFQNKKIQINFYDDVKGTLIHLSELFNTLNLLIPKNVTIKFYYYNEKSSENPPKKIGSIQGKGTLIKEWKNLIIRAASYRNEPNNEIEQKYQKKFLNNCNDKEKRSKEFNGSIAKVKNNDFKIKLLPKLKEKIKNKILSFTLLKTDDISFSNENRKVYIIINDDFSLKMMIAPDIKAQFEFDAMGCGIKIKKNKFILEDNAYSFIDRQVDLLKENIKYKILYFTNYDDNDLKFSDISFSDQDKKIYIETKDNLTLKMMIDTKIYKKFNFSQLDSIGEIIEGENKTSIESNCFSFLGFLIDNAAESNFNKFFHQNSEEYFEASKFFCKEKQLPSLQLKSNNPIKTRACKEKIHESNKPNFKYFR